MAQHLRQLSFAELAGSTRAVAQAGELRQLDVCRTRVGQNSSLLSVQVRAGSITAEHGDVVLDSVGASGGTRWCGDALQSANNGKTRTGVRIC
jgi:hypothetical protein